MSSCAVNTASQGSDDDEKKLKNGLTKTMCIKYMKILVKKKKMHLLIGHEHISEKVLVYCFIKSVISNDEKIIRKLVEKKDRQEF